MPYGDQATTTDDKPTAEASGYWGNVEDVRTAVAKRRARADERQHDWRVRAAEEYQFVAGMQWTDEDRKSLDDRKQPCVTFNRVGPIINAICGQQVCNRQETRYLPREQTDLQAAEQWTQVVRWVRDGCDAEDEESDSFRDMVITGMGWTGTTMSYEEDPEGKIIEERIDPRRLRWDPTARKKNIADARWVQCDWWYTREELRERWPDVDEYDLASDAIGDSETDSQTPHDATNAWRYEQNTFGKDLYNGRFRAIHDLHWRLEDTYQIADQGKVTKLSAAEYKQLTARLKQLGMPAPQVAKTKSRVYYEAWVVGGTVLAHGKYAQDEGFEYQAMTGLRDEDGDWYGLARALMDPQRFANKIFSQILAIINTNAKGGIIVEKTAVSNPRKFEDEWSKSDGVSWVEDGGIGRISPKPPPQIPTQLQQLLEYAIGGMREVTGVNVEFLGQTDKVQPGVVESMRTKAGLVILAPWFDALRLYMKRQGRLLSAFIDRYISDGRWVRVVGPLGPQFIQLARQPGAMRYDIIVDESSMSRDTRERTYFALSQLVPMAMQSGIPVPPDVLDYAPIPEDLRIKWKQMIAKKMAEPPQPPLPLQVEQLRQQGESQRQQLKQQGDQAEMQMQAQLKQQQLYMEAQTQRIIQAAQAESERMIENGKLQQQAWLGQMELANDRARIDMESKATAFQTVLNAVVTLQSKMEEMQMKAEQESSATDVVLGAIRDMKSQHAADMQRLIRA